MNGLEPAYMHFLIYVIENQLYGLPLENVSSAVLAVQTTPIPNSPDYILGAINVHGDILPVINTRKLLGLPLKELQSTDQFILCILNEKPLALWVDSIKTIKIIENEELNLSKSFGKTEGFKTVLKDNDKILLLYDLESLLTSRL